MQTLTASDYRLLTKIFSIKQHGLLTSMSKFLSQKYKNVQTTPDFIFAHGDIPIMVVAHLDTVFFKAPEEIFYDREKGIMWSPNGLGADDRAGVFLIIKLVQAGYRPYVLFTTNEEKGGLGALSFINMVPNPPKELKYIIQLDRCGTDDCVFYNCNNEEFITYIETFGFIEAFGSFSDISYICPAWKIAGVNLSVGYFDEHTASERLKIPAMFATFKKVCKLLDDSEESVYFKYIPRFDSFGLLEGFNFINDEVIHCDKCHKIFEEYEIFPVKENNKLVNYCPDCVAAMDHLMWCEVCGSPFVDPTGAKKICSDCSKTIFEGAQV